LASGNILGLTAFGVEASELMAAMLGHLPYTILRGTIFTHPTMPEELNQLLAGTLRKDSAM
jgi:pyruvate/2-oxoglutarate dehydrogenase complex dihydrolipoamide dehydrogenase (E3) component